MDDPKDFTFVRSTVLKESVTFRMRVLQGALLAVIFDKGCRSQFEGIRPPKDPILVSNALDQSSDLYVCLRLPCDASQPLNQTTRPSQASDLYCTCRLFSNNEPMSLIFRTSYKAFKDSFMRVNNISHDLYLAVNSHLDVDGTNGSPYRSSIVTYLLTRKSLSRCGNPINHANLPS